MPILPKQTIVSNINSEILDNSRMLISPYDVRHNLIDMIDSTHLFLNGKEISTANFSTPDTRTTICLLYTSPSPRDVEESRMPSSA